MFRRLHLTRSGNRPALSEHPPSFTLPQSKTKNPISKLGCALVTLSVCVVLGTLCPDLHAADPPWLTRSATGMVATDSPEASRIGADVLAAGGNAFDAAIAASLALTVARPQNTGVGGGGFLVAYLAREQRVVVLDFREVAPAGATRERYTQMLSASGAGSSPTLYGGNAVAVPGQLAGLAEMQRRFATRPLSELAQGAIALAERGFTVDEAYRSAVRETLEEFEKQASFKTQFARLHTTLLSDGRLPDVGLRIPRPDLAQALRLIADDGADCLYKGKLGEAIVAAVRAAGGVLSREDLAAYRVREREPIRSAHALADCEIVTMPPPSSGGICLIETLNIIRATTIRSDLFPGRDRPHVLVEALKHAFADRARWLGDPDFADVPVARLTEPAYASRLSLRIRAGRTLPLDDYGSAASGGDDQGTSHFCVADKEGNVVALTETINGVFGSYVMTEPYGILLNNEMDDFAANPGQPNLYGLVQGERNAIAPGKRPLSSMSPTIVFREGRPVLALGAAGGPRIITSVLQVLLNVIDANMPLDEAMSAPRLHHQWLPDEVCFDREPPNELADALRAAGHKLGTGRKTGVVQAIQILADGTLVGASDPRKGGRPAAP